MNLNTSELLQNLLEGEEMSPKTLAQLVQTCVAEDQYLEYKDARELRKSRPGRTLREYVSGFANAAGGILIIGVDQNSTPWSIGDCVAPGGGDLREWASRCLTDIAGYLNPPPRLQVLKMQGKNILIIATHRSSQLVPYVEGSETTYKFRIHDQTLSAPEYLISDLVLGRRDRPTLEVANIRGLASIRTARIAGEIYGAPIEGEVCRIQLFVTVENSSFVWADDVISGLVCWRYPHESQLDLNRHMLSYVDLNLSERASWFGSLVHYQAHWPLIQPYESPERRFSAISLPWKFSRDEFWPYEWRAALYVLARDQAPVWYQVVINLNNATLAQFGNIYLSTVNILVGSIILDGSLGIIARHMYMCQEYESVLVRCHADFPLLNAS